MSAPKPPHDIVDTPSSADEAEIVRQFDLRKRTYSRADLREILDLSESGVDRLLAEGLPSYRVGLRGRKVTRTAIVEYLLANRDQHAPKPAAVKPVRQRGRPSIAKRAR